MSRPRPRAFSASRRAASFVVGLALSLLVAGAVACVKIPDETAATFAPARPDEPSHYRRRDDAPAPQGFVDADAAVDASRGDGGVS